MKRLIITALLVLIIVSLMFSFIAVKKSSYKPRSYVLKYINQTETLYAMFEDKYINMNDSEKDVLTEIDSPLRFVNTASMLHIWLLSKNDTALFDKKEKLNELIIQLQTPQQNSKNKERIDFFTKSLFFEKTDKYTVSLNNKNIPFFLYGLFNIIKDKSEPESPPPKFA